MKTIDKDIKKESIELNLNKIKLVCSKTYINNSFAVDIGDEKNISDFEMFFKMNLSQSILDCLALKKIDDKTVNRSLTYTISNNKNNVLINF